jgi:hypothetical protein
MGITNCGGYMVSGFKLDGKDTSKSLFMEGAACQSVICFVVLHTATIPG